MENFHLTDSVIITDTDTAVTLEQLVENKNFLKDIQNLSGQHQTSVIEAFHSLIHFTLKMTVFTYGPVLARQVYMGHVHQRTCFCFVFSE